MNNSAAYGLATSRNFLLVEDVDLIRTLVSNLPPDALVADLGAGSGTTALSVLCENGDHLVVTYDISQENLDWTALAVRNAGHRDRWTGLLMDAAEAAGRYPDEHFDLVLLDTSHEYAATKRELAAWLPKLKHGGYLWCHDYTGDGGMAGGSTVGVRRAVQEVVRAKRLTKLAQQGLGWAGRKP